MKFRKKPVEVEAMRWLGGAAAATPVIDWVLANGGTARYHEPDYISGQVSEGIWVSTTEGVINASPGDWIIQGTRGEFYPCRPGPFSDTFEAVLPGGVQETPSWVTNSTNAAIASQVRDIFVEIKEQAVRDGGRLTPQSILSIQTAINLLENTHQVYKEMQ